MLNSVFTLNYYFTFIAEIIKLNVMKKIILSVSILLSSVTLMAQQAFPNGGFEDWNGTGDLELPVGFHSNKDGNSTAQMGPKTAYKETSGAHGGSAFVRVETMNFTIAVVNGSLTTGYINAPNTQKANGYIGTTLYNGGANDVRRITFTSRPDSLVGYFKYTPGNDAAEKGKVRIVLHKNQYYDPETPTTYHPDATADKVGSATFITENQTYSSWTRFSVPVEYVSSDNPEYLLVNITSSNNQLTTKAGSKFWLDDLEFIYKDAGVNELNGSSFNVFARNQEVVVDLSSVALENGVISIFDMSGRKISTQALTEKAINAIAIPTTVSTGVYMYKIEGNGVIKTGKLAF
jgi:hypothetical protein